VAVRSDAAKKKADAAHGADLGFVFGAVLIHAGDNFLLHLFEAGLGLTGAKREIDDFVRKGLRRGLAFGHTETPGVDEQGFFRIESEAADIEGIDIVVEAVDLGGIDRVEFIDLHEAQAGHLRFFAGIDAVGFQILADVGGFPVAQVAGHPFDKVLGGFSGGQGDDALGVFLHPFEETKRSQLAEHGKVLHLDDGDFLLRRIDELAAAPLHGQHFDLRRSGFCLFLVHVSHPPE